MSAYQSGYITGIAVFFIIVFLIIAIIAKFRNKNGSLKGEYDERQLLERGNAYKYGFTTFLAEFFIYIFLDAAELSFMNLIDTTAMLVIGIFIPLTVFVFYAIVHDAFMGYDATGRKSYTIYILIFIANGISAIVNISDGRLIRDGHISGIGLMNLLLALLFGAILLALFIKNKISTDKE